jgi:hypothetical protein
MTNNPETCSLSHFRPPSFFIVHNKTINNINDICTSTTKNNMVVANNVTVVALTADEMLRKGLILVGWEPQRQVTVREEKKLDRFKSFYGSTPTVLAKIYEDLQTTDIVDARINARKHSCDKFLMTAYFFKIYPSEAMMAGTFKVDEKTARKWIWFFAEKIQALKKTKVRLFYCCKLIILF